MVHVLSRWGHGIGVSSFLCFLFPLPLSMASQRRSNCLILRMHSLSVPAFLPVTLSNFGQLRLHGRILEATYDMAAKRGMRLTSTGLLSESNLDSRTGTPAAGHGAVRFSSPVLELLYPASPLKLFATRALLAWFKGTIMALDPCRGAL